MKKHNILRAAAVGVLCCGLLDAYSAPKTLTVKSPDGGIAIEVAVGDSLRYSVMKDGKPVVKSATIAMQMSDRTIGLKPSVKKVKRDKVDEAINPVVPLKHSSVENRYNAMTVSFKGDYAVEFRAFDNGIAHRFITTGKRKADDVMGETFNVSFTAGLTAHLQMPGGFKTAYEEPYTHMALSDWTFDAKMSNLPVLLDDANDNCILISESDLNDYPCMFLKGNGRDGVSATFPKVPVKFGEDGDRSVKILEEADYIVRTDGARSYPWRYMSMGSSKDIVEQTLTCQLASPSVVKDTSWIRPGQASWEWWNGTTPYGDDVNFVSGTNLDTYKYFIDFAASQGIPYIIMDEGWAKSTRDPYTPNPTVNVHEIVRYGKEKGVDVFLWLTWLTVENNFDLFKTFSDWGVAGLKIDFMDRSDQWMVNYYERVCAEAAKHKLMVDMHGSFKPAGLEYKYPNLMSYEGVRGMEQMGGCYPDNSLWLPFMRNAVGPMDYTPGAMISMQPECYRAERPNSASIGTRAYQLALFVIFESGIQMLADNPTLYYRNPDCTEFIASVPVTWDETRAIEAKAGQYIVVAKRKADKWYIGAITNGKEKAREFEVPLDFLSPNVKYGMLSFEDGVNAGRQAMDYRKKEQTVGKENTLKIKLARNGGWTAVLSPMK